MVRWGLITVGLTLFAVLYILGNLLLSPRSNRPPALTGGETAAPFARRVSDSTAPGLRFYIRIRPVPLMQG